MKMIGNKNIEACTITDKKSNQKYSRGAILCENYTVLVQICVTTTNCFGIM